MTMVSDITRYLATPEHTILDSSNDSSPWLPVTPEIKLYNLIFCINATEKQVLLGRKKRGMGKGMINGFGGKCEDGEMNEEAAKRELLEESGLLAVDLKHMGSVLYVVDGRDCSNLIEVYTCREWDGKPAETDEMQPQWFSYASYLGSAYSNDLPAFAHTEMPGEVLLYVKYVFLDLSFVARIDFGPSLGTDRLDIEGGVRKYEIQLRTGSGSEYEQCCKDGEI